MWQGNAKNRCSETIKKSDLKKSLFFALSLSGDLNPRPAVYETAALPTELKRHEAQKYHFSRHFIHS